MSASAKSNHELFDGGPLIRWERSLGLLKTDHRLAFKGILIAVLIGWVPLIILSTARLLISFDPSASSFFSDIAVHARFLIAVPALILAESECVPRLGRIVNHFAITGLVLKSDEARFEAAVTSTRRLLTSRVGDVVTLLVVYLIVVAVSIYFPSDALPAWQRGNSIGSFRLSAAGWWHALVSLPLLLMIFLWWIWRLLLWTRFLVLVSRLDLHLIAAHPDRVGGLKFITSSLRGFRLISLACGTVVAGSIANLQVHQGTQPLDFKNMVIALMVFLVILFAGPLTIFIRKIRETKSRGIFEYGGLARGVGTEFEEKWLRRQENVDEGSLGVQDFSATTDLYSIAGNVYQMRELPFNVKDLIGPIGVSAMLPFIPIALLAMPLEVILRGLMKLLF